jgi:hypothetical protein
VSDPQGLVTYPGLTDFTKAEYTLSTGISPGTVTIEMPQELISGLQPTGDVTFSYADQSFTLPNCVLESAHIDQALGGYIARVYIKDRRYWWTKTGSISGHYNLRMPSGSNANEGFSGQAQAVAGALTKIWPGTEMAPQDLATLCLQAMGEENYDVSALPNSSRPEVNWSWTNPAEALQQLCEGLGCRVTYVVDSDSVTIVTIGQGNTLPDNGQQTFASEGLVPAQPPSALILTGGPTIFQGYIPLEAVGVDTDGSIKPIALLSYAPAGGWASTMPIWFDFTDPLIRPLVDKIYKMWRLTLPIQIPGNNAPAVTDIRQIKLFDRLLDTRPDASDPAKRIPKKPQLWGNFDAKYKQVVNSQTGQPEPYNALEIDADRWLVYTEHQMYTAVSGDNGSIISPAALMVLICYAVRDPQTFEPIRYTRTRQLEQSQNSTQPRVIQHEDIFAKVRGSYSNWGTVNVNGVLLPATQLLTGSTDNIQSDQLDQEADYYLDAAEQEYIDQQSLDVPYAGVVPIQVDGLIHQVSYSIESGHNGKTMTRASLATEHNPYVLPWAARRRTEQQATGGSQKFVFLNTGQTRSLTFVPATL